jgi:hypothetical protein
VSIWQIKLVAARCWKGTDYFALTHDCREPSWCKVTDDIKRCVWGMTAAGFHSILSTGELEGGAERSM